VIGKAFIYDIIKSITGDFFMKMEFIVMVSCIGIILLTLLVQAI